MAKIFLDSGDSNFVIANNNTSVFGSSGTESIRINNNVTGVILDSLIETTELGGNVADFTFKAAGAGVQVFNLAGTQVALLAANAGAKAVFNDGAANLTMNTTTGAVSLGDTVVSTATAGVLAPTLDTTTTSTVSTSTGTTDSTAPVLTTATVDGSSLVLTYNEALSTVSTPAGSDFTVSVGGTAQAAPTAVVAGSTVTLTLATAIVKGDVVTVSYALGTNKINDVAGNSALALTTATVANNTVDSTAPVLTTATVDGSTLVLTYDETLADSTPAGSDFTVTVGGTAQAAPTAVVAGSTVTLTLAAAVVSGDTVTVGYTPGTNTIKDASDNGSVALTTQAVANNTVVPFKTLTLTTGADAGDDFAGTVGDDSYSASILTLGSGDSLVDATTTDNDTLTVTTNAAITNGTTITNIENIKVTALGTTTVDMANISGVKEFTTNGSTGSITINNADSAAMALAFIGTTNNNVTVNYDAGTLSGTSDSLAMTATSAKAVTVDVDAGFESATLTVNGTGNTVTSVTVPGATFALAGSGDATIADNGLAGVSSLTISNTAALQFGDITTTDLTLFSSTANTGGITGSTALAAGNIYSTDTIDGSTQGFTMMLGSGVDNLLVNEQAANAKTNTIKLGGGNDILDVANAGAGATYIFGEAGNDTIRIKTTALETTDLVDGGEDSDTLTITGDLVNNIVLLGVENLVLDGTTGALTTISSSDQALVVDVQVIQDDDIDLAGLPAGSTVAVNPLVAGATTVGLDTFSVVFGATEASSTLDINVGADDDFSFATNNITAVTADFAEIVALTSSTGDITVDTATSLIINSTKDLAFDDINAGAGEVLTSLTVNGSDKVEIDDILNDAVLETVSITATDDVSLGLIADADKLTTLTLTSSAGAVEVDEIGDNAAVLTDPDNVAITLSAGTTIAAGIIEADIAGDITMTATNGTLAAAEITSAAGLGTVALTSTAGAIDLGDGTDGIIAADTTGITVNLTGKTFISDDGANVSDDAVVTNTRGDVTSTVAGAAAANINYTAGTVNSSPNAGSVTLTANNTGGMTTVVTNNELLGNGLSAINLSALSATTANSVTLVGYSSVTNVTGSIGADTVVNSDGGDILSVPGTNSNDTYSLGTGTDTLSYAGNTHDALSGTGAAGATTDGYAMNFTSATVTFDVAAVGSATNITTLAAGKVAQYDSSAVSSIATTAGNIVAGGEIDTVSGVEVVIGSGQGDYFALANTGMTVTGGAGVDIIVANSGDDTVIFADATGDVINGYSATDSITVQDAGIALANGATNGAVVAVTGADAAAVSGANDTVINLTQEVDAAAATTIDNYQASPTGANLTAMISAIVASNQGGEAFDGGLDAVLNDAGDIAVFVVHSGTDTVAFLYTGDGTDTTLEDAEVSIIGVFDSATTVTHADFSIV